MKAYNLKETKKYLIDISNLEAKEMAYSIRLEEGGKISLQNDGFPEVIFLCVKKTRNDKSNQEFYFVVELNSLS